MNSFEIVASSTESTIVAEYTPEKRKSTDYQSEAELEQDFINHLVSQGYEYITIKSEQNLIDNLRAQLEKLNNYTFFDKEWNDFYNSVISNGNDGIVEKTRKIQEDYLQNLTLDNGYVKNIKLIDKTNIHNNHLQVINQYEEDGGKRDTRYDVTILVNGFPLVHIELKKRGNSIREAFNQINRYQRDSFWAGSGLYQYVQLFVISNGTHTKYYSNTTRFQHIKDNSETNAAKKKKTSNSFEFTSYWADEKNRTITDLVDFTKTFFAKHTLLNILTRYCVFTSEDLLLVMRPYQIAAIEKILNRIIVSTNLKKTGRKEAGGYIWHTTGSGKTLTSFKTAQLAQGLNFIDKVLFVVDRKDLDYQTMKEYDRFEKGAANSNTSTKILQKQMEDDNARIIITTIQKLDKFISKNKEHEVYKRHIVMIFDECHRSQFGDMHKSITKHFKNYHIFGFTGTPIFAINSNSSNAPNMRTTAQVFGGEPDENGNKVRPLHAYTIVDAIHDGNVLLFRIDYINTIKNPEFLYDKQVKAIDREKALLVKTFGNIVCFRNLDTATNNVLALFGDKNARGMVILKTYNEYMKGYEDEHGKHIEGYNELVARLVNEFPISSQIIGEDNEKEFIKLFSRILKLRNVLRCFDDFERDSSVSVRDLQDYQSSYIDLYQNYTKKSDIEKERINDDIVFEIELIKQVEVNIDYILMLVAKYHESNCEDKTILANINKSIDASVELRSKKALIDGFVAQMTVKTDVEKDWKDFVKKQKEQDLETIIKDEKLKHDEAQKFIENSFRDGGIKTTGTDLDKILPPISRFSGGSNRAIKKQIVIDKIKDFFEKYFDLL
ncbi:type I restriction endonuclease subunit R [Ruminococcus sp. AF13-28]|nr:type I restriction endonuclease subunit R [Ruminococcus sp. AF13-37]RGW23617.1 type I restriction endonuclease subunit R [Ruminococcus sp. AF13-28]